MLSTLAKVVGLSAFLVALLLCSLLHPWQHVKLLPSAAALHSAVWPDNHQPGSQTDLPNKSADRQEFLDLNMIDSPTGCYRASW